MLHTDGARPMPGIYQMDEADYHRSDAVSKSLLWRLHTRTPFHARYGASKETEEQKFGRAAHTAVLEPGLFEARFYRGPSDRRGNKWTAAVEIAQESGRECLRDADYDAALLLRDVMQRNEIVRRLTAGTPAIEQSAFWIDPETGELCRCRPDLYSHDLNVMADLKSTTNAKADQWQKRVRDFGYYVQDAWYRDGWEAAGGGQVDGFVFIVVERDAPHAAATYELKPRAVDKGREVYRDALRRWNDCSTNGVWPAYGSGVLPLDLSDFDYRAPVEEYDEAA